LFEKPIPTHGTGIKSGQLATERFNWIPSTILTPKPTPKAQGFAFRDVDTVCAICCSNNGKEI